MPSIRFAPLAKEHIERVKEIESVSNPAPWSYESFLHEVTNPNGRFLVAILNDEIIGYGAIWFVIDEAHITTLAIDDKHRQKGIGKQIVCALLEEAKEKGMVCATLEVRASNIAAIHLYETLGFSIAARRKGYYPNNREDALVMWLYQLDCKA